MPQNSARLDAQFPFQSDTVVLTALRLLMRVLEGRLGTLEDQRGSYDAAIEELTKVALTRINEVLLPALPLLDEIIRAGFGSDRILDAKTLGRLILRTENQAEFFQVTGAARELDLATTAATVASILNRVDAITGGADAALDTFVEVSQRLAQDSNALGTIMDALGKRLRFDAGQTLTADQRNQAQGNLGFSAFVRELVALTDAAGIRAKIEAQANLGFRPIAQGTGAGMTPSNTVIIGWGPNQLVAQVDATPLGRIWTDMVAPASLNSNGYQKLPSGLLKQWGEVSCAADQRITFPVAFPNRVLRIDPVVYFGTAPNEAWVVNIDGDNPENFAAHVRHLVGGEVRSENLSVVLKYEAFGY